MIRSPQEHTRLFVGIGFLSVFALMLVVSWLSIATLNSVNTGMSQLITDIESKNSLAYQMRDNIRQRTNAVRSLAQLTDPAEKQKVFDRLVSFTAGYVADRDSLMSLDSVGREQQVFVKIVEVEGRVNDAYRRVGNLVYAMSPQPDALKAALADVQLQELVLLNHLNDLVNVEKDLADEALEHNQQTYRKTKQLLIGFVIAAFGLSLVISALVINRVSRANRRIAYLANHDDLTGLHNRRSFEEQLRQTIGLAQRADAVFGLLYIDLDRFKIVNDTCGHHAGDQLLIQLTRMVQARLRRGDLFARLGGDEFAIIAQAKRFEDIVQLAEDLRVIVADYTFRYAGQNFKVSLSIGAIPIDGTVIDIETLLTDVDSACYVAKQSGRNRVHVTQENDVEVVKYRNDIAGMQNIRQALAEDRLTLFYQPVFRIEQQGVYMAHCEVLLRIRSENGELYSPAKFIPIAEKYNLMSEIDRWVFSNVMDWMTRHQDELDVPKLLVNLSGLSFINDEFLEFVVERLQRGDVDPSRIAFEITETAAVDNMDKANVFIDRIRALGCHFALDDFGSGFSTFAYLKNLPIDYLKIDGSLVQNMSNDTVDREMVKAINDIGHTVGAKTIAEFVEDDKTLQHLRRLGVDYAQGYGLARPQPLEELARDLRNNDRPDRYRKAS